MIFGMAVQEVEDRKAVAQRDLGQGHQFLCPTGDFVEDRCRISQRLTLEIDLGRFRIGQEMFGLRSRKPFLIKLNIRHAALSLP